MLERVLEPEAMDTWEEALAYDTMDHSEPNELFVRRLEQLQADGPMLDIGTGPGHIPLLIVERWPEVSVIGIDVSVNMIRIAHQHRERSPHRHRLEFRVAEARHLPFPDASFHTVFSNTILHHIPEPRPFLEEAWRVLRPGGAFLIRDLFRPPNRKYRERMVRRHGAGATPYQQQLFRQSLMAALTPDELRRLVDPLTFDGVEVVVDTDRHLSLQKAATPA